MRSGRNRGGNCKKLGCQLGEIGLGSGIEIKYCGQNFSELKKNGWLPEEIVLRWEWKLGRLG